MSAPPYEGFADRVPASRCCVEHDGPVVALCSHCHRPLCHVHDHVLGLPEIYDALRPLLRRRRDVTSPSGPDQTAHRGGGKVRVVDHGQERMRPERARERERHLCRSCTPWDRWEDPEILTGLVSLLAGVVVVLLAPAALAAGVGLLLVLLGAVRLAVRLVRARRRGRRRRDLPPLLGADPRVRAARVVERILVEGTLDEELRYRSRITDTQGSIVVEAQWGRAQAHRVQDLRRRHGRVIGTDPLWSAGYLVLQGRPAITPRPDPSVTVTSPNVLHLTARDSDHPALRAFASAGNANWTIDTAYEVAEDRDPARFSVRVMPTLVPREGGRALDVEVHWQSHGKQRYEQGPRLHKLDLVRIQVPGAWGPFERAGALDGGERHPKPTMSGPDWEGWRTVSWRNVPLKARSRGRHCLRLRFQHPIGPCSDEILVHVEARFAGALSGMTGLGVHHAGGAQRSTTDGGRGAPDRPLRASPVTVVELDARLCLTGLQYEDRLSLPPPSGLAGRDVNDAHTFPTTVPGHATVTRLADELSRAGYYVKRVAENPPRTAGKAMTLNRSWNLGGRYYEGVYPIDFTLNLDGEETESGGVATGTTTATLQLSGAHTTDEMKRRLLTEWWTIWGHVDGALSGLRTGETIGLPDAHLGSGIDVERILILLDDGLRRGDISGALVDKLTGLLRPTATDDEEEP